MGKLCYMYLLSSHLEGAPTKSEATLTQSEDPPTQASISEGGWESSDDEDWGSKVGKGNPPPPSTMGT